MTKLSLPLRLTEERQQHWVVVRHDKQVDAGEGGAGLEVAERVSEFTLLATAAHKHLRQKQDHKVIKTKSTGESVTPNKRSVIIIFRIQSVVASSKKNCFKKLCLLKKKFSMLFFLWHEPPSCLELYLPAHMRRLPLQYVLC